MKITPRKIQKTQTAIATVDHVKRWYEMARCRALDVEMFFTDEQNAGKKRATEAHEAKAREVCARCPVFTECLRAALDEEIDYRGRGEKPLSPKGRYGIRGGLNPQERYELELQTRKGRWVA